MESRRFGSPECVAELPAGCSHDSVRNRESDCRVMELFNVGSSGILSLNGFQVQNLDTAISCTMASSHVVIHLINGITSGQISVFLVDIGGSHSTVISQPKAKVLDNGWVGIRDLVAGQNFTSVLFDFVDLAQKVPETTLCEDRVRGEQPHSEDFGVWVCRCGSSATDDLKLTVKRQIGRAHV